MMLHLIVSRIYCVLLSSIGPICGDDDPDLKLFPGYQMWLAIPPHSLQVPVVVMVDSCCPLCGLLHTS